MITFVQLKPRMINILMNALQVESDAQNTHMLLGGLHLCVQDSGTFEELEIGPDTLHASQQTNDANLLSSGQDLNPLTFVVILHDCYHLLTLLIQTHTTSSVRNQSRQASSFLLVSLYLFFIPLSTTLRKPPPL